MEALPARIAARRQARGWSLRALAEASGVSAAMLSEIERGTKNPTVKLAYQIAQALGCSISALVDGPEVAPAADRSLRAATLLESEGVRRLGFDDVLADGRHELVVYELAPGICAGPLEPNRDGTRETVVGLEGDLEIELDGRRYSIRPGTSRAHEPARATYRNPSSTTPCRFLVLLESPPA